MAMEKYSDKEKDYLRWYTGDTRERTLGGYLISTNTSKSPSQYKLENMLLYEGIENERNRLKDNAGYLPLIKNIDDIIRMYEALIGIAEPVCDSSLDLYRIERDNSIQFLKKEKYNPSFMCCSKYEICKKFEYKNDSKEIKLKLNTAYIIDVGKILKNEYEKNDEKEVIILPFHRIICDDLKSSFIVEYDAGLTKKNISLDKVELLKIIKDNRKVTCANSVIEYLNYGKVPPEGLLKEYTIWKTYVQEYVKQLIMEKINSCESRN